MELVRELPDILNSDSSLQIQIANFDDWKVSGLHTALLAVPLVFKDTPKLRRKVWKLDK